MDIRRSRALKRNVVEETKKHTDGAGKESQDTAEEKRQATEPELPELNDGFVRALGPFTNVADFREKLKENIKLEKENQARERTRVKIAEQIIDESKIELPEILIGAELDKILYRMESDIAAMGLKFEDYMKHLNKTRDDLRREFRIDAEKKAKLGLILNKIAEIEKIAADPGEVQNETAKILEHYKDADPERARMHAENVLLNEEVFRFLERQI